MTRISRTQRTQTSSLIGGSPWKEFRGWKARYMSIRRCPASVREAVTMLEGQPILAEQSVRGRQRRDVRAAGGLIRCRSGKTAGRPCGGRVMFASPAVVESEPRVERHPLQPLLSVSPKAEAELQCQSFGRQALRWFCTTL